MIPTGTKIYSIRDLENAETANRRIAGELGEETEAGWKDLNDRVNKEDEIDPEREAELQAQHDEEAEIVKEEKRQRLIKELTEGSSSTRVESVRGLEKGEPKEKEPSGLEPFEK